MSGVRFTAWLDRDERKALRRIANEHGTSENFIVRVALRAFLFGQKVPSYLQQKDDER